MKFNVEMTKYPRLLHWMNVKVGDSIIKSAFANNMVSIHIIYLVCTSLVIISLNFLLYVKKAIVDVSLLKEELCHVVFKEAFEHFGIAYTQ